MLLAGYFCEQCRLRLGLGRVVLSPGARAHLLAYRWPGNVRELEHAIHRAIVLARGTRSGDDIVLETRHFALSDEPEQSGVTAQTLPVERQNLREATDNFQRTAIRRALEQSQYNWAASARLLEMDVANLHRLAKRLGLKD